MDEGRLESRIIFIVNEVFQRVLYECEPHRYFGYEEGSIANKVKFDSESFNR